MTTTTTVRYRFVELHHANVVNATDWASGRFGDRNDAIDFVTGLLRIIKTREPGRCELIAVGHDGSYGNSNFHGWIGVAIRKKGRESEMRYYRDYRAAAIALIDEKHDRLVSQKERPR